VEIGLVVIDENPRDALEVARAADRAGIHSIWTIDYYNRSSLTRAAAFAARTSEILVGTSITPLFARSPVAMAAAVADIQQLSGGRFVLGVGSSTRRMNRDWYGVDLPHPAPQAAERIRLLRQLLAHHSGPFQFDGPFDHVSMAHFDHANDIADVPIFAAGVGRAMIAMAGRHADGFVGHPIASVGYLSEVARPGVESGIVARQPKKPGFRFTSQIIAAASDDPDAACRDAAAQVGFYATVKGYDALFPGNEFASQRESARRAFGLRDADGVTDAGRAMVHQRAVYGTQDDVARQLRRYAQTVDWALLYPPHFAVHPAAITANEHALIEVASCWKS
jgi:alkanesulfonate monooxygenase SsuD/methylene tetrahydromethanopterin reductase-like flavin-dependent oxidoreductase (luciferase family)